MCPLATVARGCHIGPCSSELHTGAQYEDGNLTFLLSEKYECNEKISKVQCHYISWGKKEERVENNHRN